MEVNCTDPSRLLSISCIQYEVIWQSPGGNVVNTLLPYFTKILGRDKQSSPVDISYKNAPMVKMWVAEVAGFMNFIVKTTKLTGKASNIFTLSGLQLCRR